MSEKTFGQIAFEAHFTSSGDDHAKEWEHVKSHVLDGHWEASAQAVRAAVIEECAKVADKWGAGAIAEDIRSLKANPK